MIQPRPTGVKTPADQRRAQASGSRNGVAASSRLRRERKVKDAVAIDFMKTPSKRPAWRFGPERGKANGKLKGARGSSSHYREARLKTELAIDFTKRAKGKP